MRSDRGLLLELQRRKAELSGEYQLSSQETGMRMLTYADVCGHMRTYAEGRMLTYADGHLCLETEDVC